MRLYARMNDPLRMKDRVGAVTDFVRALRLLSGHFYRHDLGAALSVFKKSAVERASKSPRFTRLDLAAHGHIAFLIGTQRKRCCRRCIEEAA